MRGKTVADIALAIDAMDLMYSQGLERIALMSSDSDATRLARRLREGGIAVHGFGESKAPRAFRASCYSVETLANARNRNRKPGQQFF